MGDHGGEVPWRNACKNPYGMAELNGIIPGADIHQRFAFHEVRGATGELYHFKHLDHISGGFIPLFPLLFCEKVCQLLEMFLEQGLHLE